MTSAAHHHRERPPIQWVTIRAGLLTLIDPPEPAYIEPAPPPVLQVSLAPQAQLDKLAKHDPEHGIIKYNNKTKMDRDVNAEAFADDGRHSRSGRANVGFSAFKNKFRR